MVLRANYWLIVPIVLLLAACSDVPLYTKSYSFKNNEWGQRVKPVFRIHIPDTTNYYNLSITLRTTTNYAYSNLWLFLHSKTPNGQTGREPLEIQITQPDGSWVGEKSGTVVENNLRYPHRKFPQKGWYTFTFEQGITEDLVKEVLDISYTVELDKNQ